MKNRKSKFLLITLLTLLALLISACQVNFITDLKNDGSGVYTQEIGFQGDEASMAGLDPSSPGFCSDQNQEIPPGTTIRQETRNETETWCIYETSFASIDDLKTIYGSTDMIVNDLSLTDGKLTYDITLDLSTDSSNTTGMSIFWTVTMPGKVTENNATEQNGNTLSWTLTSGQVNNIRAVSDTAGVNLSGLDLGGWDLGGNTLWYIIGAACLCLCLIVVLVVAGVIFFLQRRKKKAANVEKPAEMAAVPPAEIPAP